ncbi:hypothetical protein C8R44DRAFT_772180 [Mycena epipterygia]|nr:hypothetical protein C8R44DRAFT_772180 [Mycena epipterygia]
MITMSPAPCTLEDSLFAPAQTRTRPALKPPRMPSTASPGPAYCSTLSASASASNSTIFDPEYVPNAPGFTYHHPFYPGILQSVSSSTCSLVGSDSSDGTITPRASTPWWLAGIGAAHTQPTGSRSEAATSGEHGWQTPDVLLSAPFVVMCAPHGAGRPRATVLVDPATKRLADRNPASCTSSNSSAKPKASAFLISPKLTPTLAAHFKSLRRVHEGGASEGKSGSVYAHASTAHSQAVPKAARGRTNRGSPSPAAPAKSPANPCSVSHIWPAKTSAASPSPANATTTASPTLPACKHHILRMLNREMKILSGRVRGDPGRVKEGRRMMAGQLVHGEYLERS